MEARGGRKHGSSGAQHLRRRHGTSQESLATSNSSIADTPLSVAAASSAAGNAPSFPDGTSPARSGGGETSTPQRHRRPPHPSEAASSSSSTEAATPAGGRSPRRRPVVLAPPPDVLCGAAANSDGGDGRRERSLRESGAGSQSALEAKQQTDVFRSPSLSSSVRRLAAEEERAAASRARAGGKQDNSSRDFQLRAREYKVEHNLTLDLEGLPPSTAALRYQQQPQDYQVQHHEHHVPPSNPPPHGIGYMSPLPRPMLSRDGGGGAAGLSSPHAACSSSRGASPRMWPSISPASGSGTAHPLALLFAPTRVGAPLKSGRATGEAPPGSAVAAISTRAEDVHPTAATLAQRQREGKLAYPSRMTFGYPALLAGGAGSSAASQRSGSIALRHTSGVSADARSRPVMRATESQVPVQRQRGFPVSRALMARRQRQHDQAELAAAARERTHVALLKTHHVPLVPFSTRVEEQCGRLGAPTVEEALMGFEFDEDDYYRGNASGVIQAPHKLMRAMTRASVRPTTPAINASSIGVGSFKSKGHGDATFSGVTKYVFGRRAGGGPMGGGRSAFLNEADPSQFWATQLSSQAHLHLDPLFPEELMIDDLADDYFSLRTQSPRQERGSPRGFAAWAGGGTNPNSSVLTSTLQNHNASSSLVHASGVL